MRRPFLLLTIALLLAPPIAGCFRSPDFSIDLGAPSAAEKDDCKSRGGTCESTACASDAHRVVESTCSPNFFFTTTCCAPGPAPSTPVPPPPKGSSTCNDDACRAGCTCRSVSATGGGCEAYCDCAVDAGKPATDAAPADAGDAGEDGSDADGGAASDGGVSSSEPPESCGTITCAPGCGCADRSLSKCRCAADACLH